MFRRTLTPRKTITAIICCIGLYFLVRIIKDARKSNDVPALPDHRIERSSDMRQHSSGTVKMNPLRFVDINERDSPNINLVTFSAEGIRFRLQDYVPKVDRNMSEIVAEETFHRFASTLHVDCKKRKRIGNMTDGGWDMCLSGPFHPRDNCLVYSIGIGDNWSFDDDISRKYNCTVRSFDPSIGKTDHRRSEKVSFFHFGIGANDTIDKETGWTLKTLASLIAFCNDENKTIDYLKIDVESNEWDALEVILKQNVLQRVKQFAIEIHTRELFHVTSSISELHRYSTILHEIELLGFRRWYWHLNLWGFFPSRTLEQYFSCCYEMVYVNINFLHPQT